MKLSAILGEWNEVYRKTSVLQTGWKKTRVHMSFDEKLVGNVSFQLDNFQKRIEWNFTAKSDADHKVWTVPIFKPLSATFEILGGGIQRKDGLYSFLIVSYSSHIWVLGRNDFFTQDELREVKKLLKYNNIELDSLIKTI